LYLLHEGIGHSSQGEQVELFAKIRRGSGGAGISETRIAAGSGHGDRLRGEGCRQVVVEPERTASGLVAGYYRKLLEKAWSEMAFVLC